MTTANLTSKDNPSVASDQVSSAPLSAQSVANYLTENSDFFAEHPDILAELALPHNSGSAVSLVERQVAILRETSLQTRHKLSEFVQAAKENDGLLQTTQSLVIDLINCRSIAQTFEMLEEKLAKSFGVESVSVLLINHSETHDNDLNQRFHKTMAEAEQAIAGILQNKTSLCGTLRETEAEFIFNGSQYAIGSAAIASKELTHQHGISTLLVAVAHHNSDHYNHETGTLFLDYLCDILAALMHRFYTAK